MFSVLEIITICFWILSFSYNAEYIWWLFVGIDMLSFLAFMINNQGILYSIIYTLCMHIIMIPTAMTCSIVIFCFIENSGETKQKNKNVKVTNQN